MTQDASSSGQDRRRAVVRGATGTFARLGYAGASLRELAQSAGMEKGHLTYYFPTKELLLFEVIDDLHDSFLQLRDRWPGDRGKAGLLVVFELHLQLVMSSTERARVAYDNFRFLGEPRRATIVAKRREYEQAVGQRIDETRAAVRIADAPTTLLTKALLGQLNWPYQWFRAAGPQRPDELAPQLARLALNTLLARR